MTQTATPAETIRGAVEQVNERGVKLGGRWFNFSKYAAVTPPARGQAVILTVKGDFISAVTVSSAPPGATSATDGHTDTADDPFAGLEHAAPPANGHARSGKANGGSYGRALTPERERTITRLSLISSAASFFAGRADATEVDVLDAAMRWEVWASGSA